MLGAGETKAEFCMIGDWRRQAGGVQSNCPGLKQIGSGRSGALDAEGSEW